MTQKNIYSGKLILCPEWIIIDLPSDIQLITVCLDYFLNPEFFLTGFLQLCFHEMLHNIFTFRLLITYVHGTVFFLLSWSQSFRQTKLSVSLCKNNSLIWYHTIFINFGVSVFIIIISTMVNIVTQLNIGKLYFDCYMIHSVIHVNCFIYLHVFWYCIHMLVDLTLQSSEKIS